MFKDVIFDFDGTIVDSLADIRNSFQKAYRLENIVGVNFEKLQVGPPALEIVKFLTPKLNLKKQKKIVTHFRQIYDSCSFKETQLMPGAKKMFTQFHRLGVTSYLATNKPILAVRTILQRRNINFFADITSIDSFQNKRLTKAQMVEHLLKKWSLNPHGVIMAGDSAEDILAGHRNGISTAAFMGGYGNKKKLLQANPKYCISRIDELVQIIKGKL